MDIDITVYERKAFTVKWPAYRKYIGPSINLFAETCTKSIREFTEI